MTLRAKYSFLDRLLSRQPILAHLVQAPPEAAALSAQLWRNRAMDACRAPEHWLD